MDEYKLDHEEENESYEFSNLNSKSSPEMNSSNSSHDNISESLGDELSPKS